MLCLLQCLVTCECIISYTKDSVPYRNLWHIVLVLRKISIFLTALICNKVAPRCNKVAPHCNKVAPRCNNDYPTL